MTALYAGSFDPITLGHADIIRRAAHMTDRLIVAVSQNSAKRPLFTIAERMELLRETTGDYPTVQVGTFSGLLAVYAQQVGAAFLVRGVRGTADVEYETNMARYNRVLTGGLDTVFIPADAALAHVTSSAVREIAMLIYTDGLDDRALETMVTPGVHKALRMKYKRIS